MIGEDLYKLVVALFSEVIYYSIVFTVTFFQERKSDMNSTNLKKLRSYLEIPISRLSAILNVSDRTITNWESDDTKQIDEANCLLLYNILIKSDKFINTIRKFVKSVYAAVNAEVICYWLRVGPEIVMFPDTSRYAVIDPNTSIYEDDNFSHDNDMIIKRINQKSLTVEPLKNSKVLNLTEEELVNHEDKRFANSAAGYCRDGVCHSCLRVPLMVPSDIGLKSVSLLSIDNKLINKKMPIKSDKKEKLFTEEDIQKVVKILETHYQDEEVFYSLVDGFSTGISQKYDI
jgi:hypothetical protein